MSDDSKKPWSPSQLRKYNLNLEPIPKFDQSDPKIDELMKENVFNVILISNN